MTAENHRAPASLRHCQEAPGVMVFPRVAVSRSGDHSPCSTILRNDDFSTSISRACLNDSLSGNEQSGRAS